MIPKKNIMQSHEEFIKALKNAVPKYTKTELLEGLEMAEANYNYRDYVQVFKDEIEVRKRNKNNQK